jgi:hypothetical protein
MKKLLIAVVAFGVLPVSAEAGVVCASAPEMKVLQSTALQQQLMVAALTCRMREEYNRFVTTYRDGLVQSDTALKAFFASRPRGESYNAYKTRIANTASLRSVHDSHFCDSARKVFDMALGRRMERRGLAPEPPQLVDTGYEGCRAVDNSKLIEANARPAAKNAMVPKPRPAGVPAIRLADAPASLQMARPVPTPKPVVTAEAVRALALRPQMAAKQTTPQPVRVATAVPKSAPLARAAVKAAPVATPVLAAKTAPQPAAQRALPVPPSRSDWGDDDRSQLSGDPFAQPQRDGDAPQRYAASAAERRQPRAADADDPYADNPIPNAYRPGAEWVVDDGAWQPVRYDRSLPRNAYWVLDPDGRWVLVVPRGSR